MELLTGQLERGSGRNIKKAEECFTINLENEFN